MLLLTREKYISHHHNSQFIKLLNIRLVFFKKSCNHVFIMKTRVYIVLIYCFSVTFEYYLLFTGDFAIANPYFSIVAVRNSCLLNCVKSNQKCLFLKSLWLYFYITYFWNFPKQCYIFCCFSCLEMLFKLALKEHLRLARGIRRTELCTLFSFC